MFIHLWVCISVWVCVWMCLFVVGFIYATFKLGICLHSLLSVIYHGNWISLHITKIKPKSWKCFKKWKRTIIHIRWDDMTGELEKKATMMTYMINCASWPICLILIKRYSILPQVQDIPVSCNLSCNLSIFVQYVVWKIEALLGLLVVGPYNVTFLYSLKQLTYFNNDHICKGNHCKPWSLGKRNHRHNLITTSNISVFSIKQWQNDLVE